MVTMGGISLLQYKCNACYLAAITLLCAIYCEIPRCSRCNMLRPLHCIIAAIQRPGEFCDGIFHWCGWCMGLASQQESWGTHEQQAMRSWDLKVLRWTERVNTTIWQVMSRTVDNNLIRSKPSPQLHSRVPLTWFPKAMVVDCASNAGPKCK